jgi:hypothetical protein
MAMVRGGSGELSYPVTESVSGTRNTTDDGSNGTSTKASSNTTTTRGLILGDEERTASGVTMRLFACVGNGCQQWIVQVT